MAEAIRPFVQIVEPEPLVAHEAQTAGLDVLVFPKALGVCKLRITLLADECVFQEPGGLTQALEREVFCSDLFKGILTEVRMTLVCSTPGSQPILIRVYAEAQNSEGGVSARTPDFNVDFRPAPRIEDSAAPVLPDPPTV
ncbi:MAG: hypothetical protein NW241_10745 [Bacteroidia bacterium]|nr:hypothetical protein [Bacteroidia bacterium]